MKMNYLKLSFINYIYLVILEVLFKIFVMNTYDIGFLYIAFFSLPIAFIITFISSLFKNRKVNRVISIIMWFIIFAIFAAETIYFSFYKTICGLSALTYGGQVMEFYNSILMHVKAHIVLLIFYLLPFIGLLVMSFKNIISHEKYKIEEVLLLIVPTLFMTFTLVEVNKKDTDSAYNLYYNTNDLMESTNRFGVISSVVFNDLPAAILTVAVFPTPVEPSILTAPERFTSSLIFVVPSETVNLSP